MERAQREFDPKRDEEELEKNLTVLKGEKDFVYRNFLESLKKKKKTEGSEEDEQ